MEYCSDTAFIHEGNYFLFIWHWVTGLLTIFPIISPIMPNISMNPPPCKNKWKEIFSILIIVLTEWYTFKTTAFIASSVPLESSFEPHNLTVRAKRCIKHTVFCGKATIRVIISLNDKAEVVQWSLVILLKMCKKTITYSSTYCVLVFSHLIVHILLPYCVSM